MPVPCRAPPSARCSRTDRRARRNARPSRRATARAPSASRPPATATTLEGAAGIQMTSVVDGRSSPVAPRITRLRGAPGLGCTSTFCSSDLNPKVMRPTSSETGLRPAVANARSMPRTAAKTARGDEAVEPIHKAAVAGNEWLGSLTPKCRFTQDSKRSPVCDDRRREAEEEQGGVRPSASAVMRGDGENSRGRSARRRDAAHRARPGLRRRDPRQEFRAADHAARRNRRMTSVPQTTAKSQPMARAAKTGRAAQRRPRRISARHRPRPAAAQRRCPARLRSRRRTPRRATIRGRERRRPAADSDGRRDQSEGADDEAQQRPLAADHRCHSQKCATERGRARTDEKMCRRHRARKPQRP